MLETLVVVEVLSEEDILGDTLALPEIVVVVEELCDKDVLGVIEGPTLIV